MAKTIGLKTNGNSGASSVQLPNGAVPPSAFEVALRIKPTSWTPATAAVTNASSVTAPTET